MSRSAHPLIRHDIAVVIGTYQREELLRSTIKQLAMQATLPGTCVVVDQGDFAEKRRSLPHSNVLVCERFTPFQLIDRSLLPETSAWN